MKSQVIGMTQSLQVLSKLIRQQQQLPGGEARKNPHHNRISSIVSEKPPPSNGAEEAPTDEGLEGSTAAEYLQISEDLEGPEQPLKRQRLGRSAPADRITSGSGTVKIEEGNFRDGDGDVNRRAEGDSEKPKAAEVTPGWTGVLAIKFSTS